MLVAVIIIAVVGIGSYLYIKQNGTIHDQATTESEETMMKETGTQDTMMEGEETSDAMMKEDGDTMMEGEEGAMMDDKQVKTFEITGQNFSFDPAEITVNKGDTVKIVFKSVEGNHNFVLDEFDNAKTDILGAGESETIEFVADRVGTFEYYCAVGNHRAMGMVGTLIVE
ncbi:cupredoxin domain-containing protein [Candidatus Woesebacteria bacterium]|nr:cupredoxin domain-containing protein [Candidatus Woesebacteria bacterium]